MVGLTAAKTLLQMNYKLQLVASSHYFDKKDDEEEAFYYGPNALFQSEQQLHRFLYERSTRALQAEVYNIRRQQHCHQYASHLKLSKEDMLEVRFHSLLFATHGLDLAIQSRFSYVYVGNHKQCADWQHGRQKRCDPKLEARALNDTIFLECPKRHNSVALKFLDREDTLTFQQINQLRSKSKKLEELKWKLRMERRTEIEKENGILVDVNKQMLKTSDVVDVWRGSPSPDHAEAVCVKLGKNALLPRVSCTTRIVPQRSSKSNFANHNANNQPNLIVIVIDPLSRQQMKRSLPNTFAMLNLLGFVQFHRYTAVGNNSGPNQAALYSGRPLEGREGIRTSNSHGNDNNRKSTRTWLWDRLNAEGYVTLKAEDGCISNSNMIQSIRPQTHHGKQLHDMFCFYYDRPNCLGGKLAAEHLLKYTRQFFATYNGGNEKNSAYAKPWAAFLSFVDSHEDTLTLISYLDRLLVDFIQDIAMHSNTMIIFTSDHGLHYGPTFSSRSGELERAQPNLFIRMPTFEKFNTLQRNAGMFTTAFDVHETILEVLLGRKHKQSSDLHGVSLAKPLPQIRSKCDTTSDIPSNFCRLFDGVQQSMKNECTFMLNPPSIFSYYSDIPQTNRPHWPISCPIKRNHTMTDAYNDERRCFCATNKRDWFECSNMTHNHFRKGIDFQEEHFSLRSCSRHELDHSLELDIHVARSDRVAAASQIREQQSMKKLAEVYNEDDVKASFDARPNIIFLEIDSVSLSFSERHFPKTWNLLNTHKIKADVSSSLHCPTGWCVGMFNKTSIGT